MDIIWYRLSRERSFAAIQCYLLLQLNQTISLPQRTIENCYVSYAVNNYLVKSILPASHPYRNDSVPPVTPFPIGTGGGA